MIIQWVKVASIPGVGAVGAGYDSVFGDDEDECRENFGTIHGIGTAALAFIPFAGPLLAAGALAFTPWLLSGVCGGDMGSLDPAEVAKAKDAAGDYVVSVGGI